MEEEETERADEPLNDDTLSEEDFLTTNDGALNTQLDRRTRRKLDFILLPFVAILFLLNSLDKSNIGNAETAGFTRDAGLEPDDLNISMAFFFAFFVALQPVGAALGRKVGMARWVPACMSLWGLCTLLHMWVRTRWQLICLRIAIASLEAGFYPTTVSYLSLFYTRYEFAVRLSFFYGQTAVAGVLGGVLSWGIFSHYENRPPTAEVAQGGWKSWEALFLIEGCMTIVVALIGFVWLPLSADTAWFFNAQERRWAEQRIRLDRDDAMHTSGPPSTKPKRARASHEDRDFENEDEETEGSEAHERLLHSSGPSNRHAYKESEETLTAHAGLSWQDIYSALFNYKIWHILACNILSAIPATAFGVFLPMVIKQLSPSLNMSPSASNLLSAPPFAFGALMLFIFAFWSDRKKQRLIPIFMGLILLIAGLTATVMIPMSRYFLRYIALCILISGSYIASPLAVTWLTNNTPEPGKRALLLGINGWGNLAGVLLLVLFTPEERKNGYLRSFIVTLACALTSLAGFVAFYFFLKWENRARAQLVGNWTEDEREREDRFGDMPIPSTLAARLQQTLGFEAVTRRFGVEGRKGDEKMTFQYGL